MNIHSLTASIPFFRFMKGYNRELFKQDLMGGLTVGMIAVPLSMALAINSGVPPQYGLYTAIVAGFLIALCGGSRFNVSGPTAAFVIILQPITAQFGLAGLLTASFLAGIILVIMGIIKLGKMVYFVPQPVTTGFSTGIAVVIALTQIPDFLGTPPTIEIVDFFSRIKSLAEMVHRISYTDLFLGTTTLIGMFTLPKVLKKVPPHLIVLGLSAALGALLAALGYEFRTIDSVFSYTLNGQTHSGIPAILPSLSMPWFNEAGHSILSFEMIRALLPSVFAIALLGAIESLLCAVVADGMMNTRHDPDAELIGLGIGNIIAPFFGGFAATGALARTAASIRAGAKSPIASMIHALFVFATLLLFARLLGYLPMASLAALLLIVAWNMANVRYFKEIILMSPNQDRVVLLVCFSLTVIFDMVIAVMVGMVLASFVFMARMSNLIETQFLSTNTPPTTDDNALETIDEIEGKAPIEETMVLHYEISGPFFFGAARKAIESFERLFYVTGPLKIMIIYMEKVPFIDLTGIITFKSMINNIQSNGVDVILSGLNPETKKNLGRSSLSPKKRDGLYWAKDSKEANALALSLCAQHIDANNPEVCAQISEELFIAQQQKISCQTDGPPQPKDPELP